MKMRIPEALRIPEYFFLREKKYPVRGVLSTLGGFILCLSFSVVYSYGNLNSYMTSYMRSTEYNPELTYMDFVFVTTTNGIVQGALMPVLGMLARKLGVRRSIFIGSFIYSSGVFLTSWSLQSYFGLVILTMAMNGVGFGFIYSTAIGNAQRWFRAEARGVVSSIVIAGYGFGGLIWIPVQTSFVNPNNVKATEDPECLLANNLTLTKKTCDKYYTHPDVLERVPTLFLMLGCIYMAFGLVATLLISEPPREYDPELELVTEIRKKKLSSVLVLLEVKPMKTTESDVGVPSTVAEDSGNTEEMTEDTASTTDEQSPDDIVEKEEKETLPSDDAETDEDERSLEDEKCGQNCRLEITDEESAKKLENCEKEVQTEADNTEPKVEDTEAGLIKKHSGDYSPKEVIKTKAFYLVWICFLGIQLTQGIITNFAKVFGLTFINDDHFYARMSIVSNILNGSFRIVWGFLYDRVKFRGCYFAMGTIVIIFAATFPALPYLGSESRDAKAAFGIWQSALYMAIPCIYVIVAAYVRDLYGQEHFQANFGVLFTQNVAYSLIIIVITKVPAVSKVLGYPGLFEVGAGVACIGMISCLFLPSEGFTCPRPSRGLFHLPQGCPCPRPCYLCPCASCKADRRPPKQQNLNTPDISTS